MLYVLFIYVSIYILHVFAASLTFITFHIRISETLNTFLIISNKN